MSMETALPESPSGQTESTQPETAAALEVASPAEAPTDVEEGGQRQSESVPYSRFSEVNSRLSALEQRAKSAGYESAADYIQALEAYTESQNATYDDPSEETDPVQAVQQQLGQVQEVLAEQLFTTQFAQMKATFPQAEAEEVKRALIYGEARDLQTAMKQNHARNEAKRQAAIADYNRTQQQRQGAAVEGAGGGSSPGGVDYASMTDAQIMSLANARIEGRA